MIECGGRSGHALRGEVAVIPILTGDGEGAAFFGIGEQFGDRGGECGGVGRRNEQAGLLVCDDFGGAAGARGDYWFGKGHGFEDDEAEGFGERGEDEKIAGIEQGGDVVAEAKELDAIQ